MHQMAGASGDFIGTLYFSAPLQALRVTYSLSDSLVDIYNFSSTPVRSTKPS